MEPQELKKTIYTCDDCSLTFLRSESFKKHMLNFHRKSVVVCSNCPLFFDDLGKLFLHARQIHNAESRPNTVVKKHKCEYETCNYQTDNGGLLRHHMLSHLRIKPYVCPVCQKRFTQKSNMKTHFHRHKKHESNFRCEDCEIDFNSHDTYLSHLSTREHQISTINASTPVDFKCLKCSEVYESPEEIHQHVASCPFYTEFPVECMNCYEKLPNELETIKIHSKSHKNSLCCPHCPTRNVFDDKTKLNFHLTKVHGDKVVSLSVCRYCENSFDNEQDKKDHINEKHKDMKNKHCSRGDMGRIKCPLKDCTFSTNSKIYAQKHFLKHFGKVNSDVLYCGSIKLQSNENEEQVQKPRKRGRPRLCDQVNNSLSSNFCTDESYDNFEHKKKRGRPRKHEINEAPRSNEIKKRGRPRKVQNDIKTDPEISGWVSTKIEPINVPDCDDDYNYDADEFESRFINNQNNFQANKAELIDNFNSFDDNEPEYNIDGIDYFQMTNNLEDFQDFNIS